MSNESPPLVRPRRRLPRVPAFYFVPAKSSPSGRHLRRQAGFLGWLAETGSVPVGCARAGMSRNSACRLRERPRAESFAAAWDAALGKPIRRVTIDDLEYPAYRYLVEPRFRAGKHVAGRQDSASSALLPLIGRYDRALARIDRLG